MTSIPLTTTEPVFENPVAWRQLQRRLWSGTRAGLPLGTIEQGRQYTSISEAGAVLGRFGTLLEAQASLTGPIPVIATGAAAPVPPRALIALSTITGVLALALAAIGLLLIR